MIRTVCLFRDVLLPCRGSAADSATPMETFKRHILYRGKSAPLHYLCGYIPGRFGDDALSSRILAFKSGRNAAVLNMWQEFAIEAFREFDIGPDDIIIRALSHRETCSTSVSEERNPLAKLARGIAGNFDCAYLPELIHKRKATRRLVGLSRDNRWKEAGNSYTVDKALLPASPRSVWLVDDVITTGSTARAIWKALLGVMPNVDFNVFTLARTAWTADANEALRLEGPDCTWEDGIMVLHEPETIYEPAPISASDLTSPEFDNEHTFII